MVHKQVGVEYNDMHKRDHDRIIEMLDCTEKVISLEKDILLIQEKLRETKEDREKSSRTLLWICSAAFTIIMAVGAFGIQSKADIQVLQEKVKEQKKEIEKFEDSLYSRVK